MRPEHNGFKIFSVKALTTRLKKHTHWKCKSHNIHHHYSQTTELHQNCSVIKLVQNVQPHFCIQSPNLSTTHKNSLSNFRHSYCHRCTSVRHHYDIHICSFKPAEDFGEPKLLSHHEETFSRCNDPYSQALTSSFLFLSSVPRSTSLSRSQEPCCNVYKKTQQNKNNITHDTGELICHKHFHFGEKDIYFKLLPFSSLLQCK